MFQQTIIRYCKFSNSNKKICGRSNRASIAKLLTRYHNINIITSNRSSIDIFTILLIILHNFDFNYEFTFNLI